MDPVDYGITVRLLAALTAGGAILRDGLSVRGLTTAASIWITAAIGILIGIGFYFPAVLTSVLTVGTLSAMGEVRFRASSDMTKR
jgi:putative Mg2+ transporter-C (MgtC) family protein